MSDTSLVFKIYGDFHWPPAVDPQPGTTLKRGCIEIHYAWPSEASNSYRAYLVWKPREVQQADPGRPGDGSASLYSLSDTAAVDWFENNDFKSIWIDGPLRKTINPRLVVFRGAYLLEQYSLDGQRELRWPLVPEYKNDGGVTIFSALTLTQAIRKPGNTHYPRFDFDLSLPLPANHSDEGKWAAFMLRAVFYPQTKSNVELGQINEFYGRGLNKNGETISSQFKSLPGNHRLGSFDLAAVGNDKSPTCLSYNDKNSVFWPKSQNLIIENFLNAAGLSAELKGATNVRNELSDNHLRFGKPQKSEECTLVYRTSTNSHLTLNKMKELTPPFFISGPAGFKIHFDFYLRWFISDEEVLTPEVWKSEIGLRLYWSERFPKGELSGLPTSPFARKLLADTADSANATRTALTFIEGLQQDSVLPELKVAPIPPAIFHISTFILISENLKGYCKKYFISKDRQSGSFINFQSHSPCSVRMTLANDESSLPKELFANVIQPDNNLPLVASLPAFFRQHKPGVSDIGFSLRPDEGWAQREASSEEAGSPYFASFALNLSDVSEGRSRIGGLLFTFPRQSGLDIDPDFLRTGGRGIGDPQAFRYSPKNNHVNATIRITLPVSTVTPLSTDVARTDRSRRPAPLLIDMSPTSDAKPSDSVNYYLQATETFGTDYDRLLTVSLMDNAQERGEIDYLVLAEEPYSILRFRQTRLGARGNAGSTEVALYSSDDRLWQYRMVSPLYHFMLPPQAIGESADKPNRLELHDLPKLGSTPPHPYVGVGDPQGKALKYRAVEFRLTPSTDLWVQPSDVARGYFIPEQASYELFRQRGEYGLGAALAGLRSEFLYGLSVSIEVSKERSVARFTRVSEISALTGIIVGPAREQGVDKKISERWSRLSRAIARRPERLELWTRDPDSPVDFAPARFAEGTNFALRSTALHRPPLAQAEAKDDSLPAEVPGQLRFHPHGLSGGALWPIESINLLNSLKDAPTSYGGTLEKVALAPFGGDACQTGDFLNGILRIISETRNGCIERQKVEVLGRIGSLWHRAKHVVVYERTVNPTAQFAPAFGTDAENSRSRRPILRKVREYIELLQPERLYPDFPQAAVRTTGFLDRVRFNSRIINVDSAWGSEVGTFGWQVPLWNRAAARQRPQVYSMPDIAFVTVSEGDGETPLVAQECLDTDMLFFFADFKAGTSETDLWQARLDIDFANLPLAQTIAKSVDQASSARPEHNDKVNQRRPAVSRALPGARRFTWRLAPAARKTAINAGRADKPVYVGLESVSFMRATFTPKDEGEQKFAHLGALLSTSDRVELLSDQDLWMPGKASNLAGVDTAQYVVLIDTLMAAKDQQSLTEAYGKLKKFVTTGGTFSTSLGSALQSNAQKLYQAVDTNQNGTGSFLSAVKTFDKKLAEGQSGCQILKDTAVGHLRRKSLLICTLLQDWQAGVDSLTGELQGLSKDQAINSLAENIKNNLTPLFKEASDDVGNVAEGVEKARAILLTVESDVEKLVTRAFARIDQLVVAYDGTKPWSSERKRAFRTDIRSAISSIAIDINGSIDEARKRLSVELGDFAQGISSQLGRALSLLAIEQHTALSGLGALNIVIRRKLDVFILSVNELASGNLDLFAKSIEVAHKTITESALAKPPNNTKRQIELRDKVLAALENLIQVQKTSGERISSLLNELYTLTKRDDEVVKGLVEIVEFLSNQATELVENLQDANTRASAYSDELSKEKFDDLKDLVLACWPHVEEPVTKIQRSLDNQFVELTKKLDELDYFVDELRIWIHDSLFVVRNNLRNLNGTIDDAASGVNKVLDGLKQQLAPESLLDRVIIEKVVKPALVEILEPLPDTLTISTEERAEISRLLALLTNQVAKRLETLDHNVLGGMEQITDLCKQVFGSIDTIAQSLDQLANQTADKFSKKFEGIRDQFVKAFDDNVADINKVLSIVKDFDRSVRNLQNDISRTVETAQMYGNRVLAAASRLGEGDLMAAPSNILKLYSAVSSTPEMLGLTSDIERIRAGFDYLSDIIDTTEAGALLNRMGDQLKALGISSNFDKISDRLLLKADEAIGKLFHNISGADLSNLLKGQMPKDSMGDAIRLTHDFDRQQARAWVQVEIKAPMPGRNTLFKIGPFQCDFVGMEILGQMRLEVSKDSEELKQSGFGRLSGTLDMMVNGQSMVSFDKFALNFTREKGLKIDFDPKNIRLNPAFQFVQDTLASLFPDMIGPLIVIKENGIPIGLEHEYVLPVISANAVTSGMSNLSIENRLRLIAYPDFVISDRFSLSRPERPFIFSLFILGGTGFVQIETEYRPFDSELTVIVDAAMGASALIGISAGPFSGQIFITLSAVLSYRKTLGRPGGGLSVSALLVIAGNVDVAGIATAGIYATLRITYRDNGQVDADGTISVTIKISTFFTLSARASIQYRLRNGHAETRTTSTVDVDSPELKEIADKASAAANKIQGAMV